MLTADGRWVVDLTRMFTIESPLASFRGLTFRWPSFLLRCSLSLVVPGPGRWSLTGCKTVPCESMVVALIEAVTFMFISIGG